MQYYKIKVSDLLHAPGSKDEIELKDLIISRIEGLTEKGIQGTILLESLSDDSVNVTMDNIQCEINDICDTCSKPYVRSARTENYQAMFTSDKQAHSHKAPDEIFIIDTKENIDVAEALVQTIGLNTPFIKKCYDCINKQQAHGDDWSDEEFSEQG